MCIYQSILSIHVLMWYFSPYARSDSIFVRETNINTNTCGMLALSLELTPLNGKMDFLQRKSMKWPSCTKHWATCDGKKKERKPSHIVPNIGCVFIFIFGYSSPTAWCKMVIACFFAIGNPLCLNTTSKINK